ncbi:MAG: hypothetical protein GY804_13185 [Alphaproteobacteria bacterium]|nr:hypothetical protein [Alphaproteobacteria bacterium]
MTVLACDIMFLLELNESELITEGNKMSVDGIERPNVEIIGFENGIVIAMVKADDLQAATREALIEHDGQKATQVTEKWPVRSPNEGKNTLVFEEDDAIKYVAGLNPGNIETAQWVDNDVAIEYEGSSPADLTEQLIYECKKRAMERA